MTPLRIHCNTTIKRIRFLYEISNIIDFREDRISLAGVAAVAAVEGRDGSVVAFLDFL